MKLNRKAHLVVFMEAAVCCWKKNCQNFGLLFKNSDLIISFPLRFELLNGHFGIIPEF